MSPLVGITHAGTTVPIDWNTGTLVLESSELIAVPEEALDHLVEASRLRNEGDLEGGRAATEAALEAVGLTPQDLPTMAAQLREKFPLPTSSSSVALFDNTRIVTVEMLDELWLREFLDLDTHDVSELIEFIAEWGPLTLPQALMAAPDVVRLSPTMRARSFEPISVVEPLRPGLAAADEALLEHRTLIYEHLFGKLSLLTEVGDMSAVWSTEVDDEVVNVTATSHDLDAQALVAEFYQAVFLTLVELNDDDLDEEAIKEAPRPELVTPWAQRGLPKPEVTLDVVDTVIDAVSSAAAALGPRAELTHPALEGGVGAYGRPVPRVITAMALQALAWIADGIPVRTCANETCGQWFTRQRGRAEAGQYRSTGVLYCSAPCAKAQAQRGYRRRKRAQPG